MEGNSLSSHSEKIQTLNQSEFVDLVEDWDLRTPIAPPPTSLEGARVISVAGTSKEKELVRSDVSLSLSETDAREQSEILLSDHHLSAHTDTYTPNTELLAQIKQLQQELEQTKADNQIYKAQVEEQSSSSTSVHNQLPQLTNEVENIRVSLIPRLNSIHGTQMIQAEDISSMTDSHVELANSPLQLDFIQGQLFNILNQVNHNDAYIRTHFREVEGSIEHLTTGMSLLYSMIKKINTTIVADRNFFEGCSGGGGEGGLGSGAGSGDGNKGNGKEDPHASRAKSIEDSSTKGDKPSQEKP